MRYFIILLFLGLLMFPSALWAACDPAQSVCVGQGCSKLGLTTMDRDGKNLIACLTPDTSGSPVWKSMTSSADPNAGVMRLIGTRSSTGTWTLSGLIVGKPLLIGAKHAGGGNWPRAAFRISSGAHIGYSPQSYYFLWQPGTKATPLQARRW